MVDELRHEDTVTGTTLQRTDWEDVDSHRFDSQATGDIMYASSAVQLSRRAIGAVNTVLHVAGGLPVWSAILAGLTLTAPVINGVVATTGLTLPAHTLGGNIDFNDYLANNIADLSGKADDTFYIRGKRTNAPNALLVSTPGVGAGFADVTRLIVTGTVAKAVWTFSDSTLVGMVLSDDLTFSTSVDSALVANEVSLSGFDIGGARSLAISQENPVVVEAIGASDRTLPVRINGADFKIMLHT